MNMGISVNSHGRKVDKGTQSPLLKIFKEIMTREKDDPEKRNLLVEQKEDKKRRLYSGSRTKTERRSCESSSSEHRKRGNQYKTSSTEQRADFKHVRPQSLPYQSEKKDSWWFWQKDQKEQQKKQTEDTCSCVSCALKRIVSSEYACVGCLLLLFTISIIVAFLVVFKSVPNIGGGEECSTECTTECKETTTTTTCPPPKCKMPDSERLKRKIEMLSDNGMKNEFSELDEFRKNDYDKDSFSGNLGIPGVAGIDFGPSFRELNSLDESENKLSNDIDWSSVLDAENGDVQSSERLKEFYKKLVQTDAKIKSLKKLNQGMSYIDNNGMEKSPERSKRSLKLYNYPKRYHMIRHRRSTFNKDGKIENLNRRKGGNRTRTKRHGDIDDPTGFVIEKKKLIVQYKPSGVRKKIPVKKCSHAPKDVHTHENQLKHPFYKNTQRLDELLDLFLNKNLPEIMSDPFGLDVLFKHDKSNKCKHPSPAKNVNIIGKEQLVDQIPKPRGKFKKVKEEKKEKIEKVEGQDTADFLKMLRPESTTQYEQDFYHHEVQMIGKEKQKIVTASPSDFEVLLSVSTIMNPDLKKTKVPVAAFLNKAPVLDKVPGLRRLMQIEGEDDENLGYEDFKEVLTDDLENHDDMDKPGDRRKRRDDSSPQHLAQRIATPLQPIVYHVYYVPQEEWIQMSMHDPPMVPPEKFTKYNPPGVHNPNWKGPMPLYPDELNSMIKHAAMNANKVEIPTFPSTMNDLQPELLTRKGRDLSDVEYVEDYLRNKYDKLVEMAQAYSDYGVLDGKKESRNEKNSPADVTATDHRIKLSADEKFFKAGLLARLKRGRVPSVVTETTAKVRRQRDVLQYDLGQHNDITTTEQTGGITNAFFYTKPPSEGLRFEIRPTTKLRDDDVNLLKILQKHVTLKPEIIHHVHKTNSNLRADVLHSTLISSYPDMELVCSRKANKPEKTATPKIIFKTQEEIDKENGIFFSLGKGKRNLLSTDFKSTGYRSRVTNGYGSTTERNRNNIDRFVHNLNLRKYNFNNESALSRYIERVKQKNIRIYSTALPDMNNISTTTTTVTYADISTSNNLNLLTDPIKDVKDTVVTINKSEIRMDEYSGNNFQGKILLTVENPDIGVEHIDLQFDVPLVINFNDELMMMNDNLNFPNVYNQFEIFTDTTIDPNEVDLENYLGPDFYEIMGNNTNNSGVKRYKRNATLSTPNITEVATVVPVNITTNSSINLNVSLKSNRATNKTDSDMTLSDFFMMVSDWFKALEGVKVDKPRENSGSELTEMLLKLNTSNETNATTESSYPLYDSDMIENIGHRSRVLLSVEKLGNGTDGKKEIAHANVTKADAVGNVSSITKTPAPILTVTNTNVTITIKESSKKSKAPKKLKKGPKPRKVKAIFKRNADDSNLIFWNDVYDDEYGIQTDKLNNPVRDKHSVKENDFIKRSGRWVHDKIKKFAENLKINPRSEDMAIKERLTRSVKKSELPTYPKYIYDRIYDRVGRKEPEDREEDYNDADQRSVFTALSANMKDVCKKAAKAVQLTRNIEVREDSKQGSIASTLMQQLVRLLTDLVDYQVQQKTCTKLPPELQSFLEWLTYPKEDPQVPEPQTEAPFKSPFQEEDLIEELEMQNNEDKTTERQNEYGSSGDRQGPIDLRMHYVDCLHAVQDLLDQYDDMNDEEKSKTTGVKCYLENQVKYLNKQLSGYDLFSLLEKHNAMRYKRDLTRKNTIKRRPKRKLNKFIKKFGKKHTRTTANYYDGVQVTDMKRITVKNDDTIDPKAVQDFDEKVSNDVKRNLKDVYYKAIAEAKKYATAKNVHKKDEVSHFESSTVKMHQ